MQVKKTLQTEVRIRFHATIELMDVSEDQEHVLKAHIAPLVRETLKIVAEEVKKEIQKEKKRTRVYAE